MKNHFFIGYFGNKRGECEHIYNAIKHRLDDIEYIIEPFCGSSALSYYLSIKHPKKFKYILNDNNEMLIQLYNKVKNNEEEELINKLNDMNLRIKNKEDYLKEVKDHDTNLTSYIYGNKVYCIRPYLYPDGNKKFSENCFDTIKNAPMNDFLKNEDVIISKKDAIEVYEEWKDNPKALIFLDPPYLISNNSWYKNPNVNIYEYLCSNDIKNNKAYICLCLEDIWIIKLLFQGKKIVRYEKVYQTTKKKTNHIIITNEINIKNT